MWVRARPGPAASGPLDEVFPRVRLEALALKPKISFWVCSAAVLVWLCLVALGVATFAGDLMGFLTERLTCRFCLGGLYTVWIVTPLYFSLFYLLGGIGVVTIWGGALVFVGMETLITRISECPRSAMALDGTGPQPPWTPAAWR